MRPKAHWDFVGSTSRLSNGHALVFPMRFLCLCDRKISFRSLILRSCAATVPELQRIHSGSSQSVVEAQVRQTISNNKVDDRGNVSCGDNKTMRQRRPEIPKIIQAISCTFTSSKPLVSGGGSWLLSMEDSLPVLSPERSLVTLRSAFSVCTSFPMLISPKSLII